MASPRPKFVLFDLGNVLVHIDPASFLRSLGIDSEENQRSCRPWVTGIMKRYEHGDDSTEEHLARLDALFNSPESKLQHNHGGNRLFTSEEFRNAMLTVIGRPVAGMEELVQRVAASVQVGLLSNTNPLHYEWCLNNLPVLEFIFFHFLSYKLRSLKPERAIFNMIVKLLQVHPNEILYIDDLPDNVEAARAVGFGVHLFVGRDELEQQLKQLALL